jgi:hypothetical protein
MPNHYSYAPDALSPLESLNALDAYPVPDSGWCSKYPMGHYLLTGLLYQPYLWYLNATGQGAEFRQAIDDILTNRSSNSDSHFRFLRGFVPYRSRMARLFLIGNGLSAVMGVCAVLLLYVVGRQLGNRLAGLIAGIIAASYGATVYHTHTLNVDMPYVFWLMLTFPLFLKALASGKTRWFVLCAMTAGIALATKDQAYGVLAAVPIILALFWKQPDRLFPGVPPREHYPWRQVVFALVTFGLVYAIANDLFLNWHGFRKHLTLITHEASEPFREVPATARGQLQLFGKAGSVLSETLPWPVLVLLGAGIAIGLVLRPAPTVLCVLPALAYYATYIAMIGYCYARFLIPIVFFLALPAGKLISDVRRVPGAMKYFGLAVGVACLAVSVYTGAEVDVMLLNDPRVKATEWMKANLTKTDRVMVISEMTFQAPAVPDGIAFDVFSPARAPLKERDRVLTQLVKELDPTYVVTCFFLIPSNAPLQQVVQRPVTVVADFPPSTLAQGLQKTIRLSPQVRIHRVTP